MENKVSFVELLKETAELIRDHRPFNRGTCSKQISEVLRRELISTMPIPLKEFPLEQAEVFFVATLLVEPDSCRDIIKHFSRFWASSYEMALKTQMDLELSIHQGQLKKFIDDDGASRLRINSEMGAKVLVAMIERKTAE